MPVSAIVFSTIRCNSSVCECTDLTALLDGRYRDPELVISARGEFKQAAAVARAQFIGPKALIILAWQSKLKRPPMRRR
jgi:hypothetical protein